MSPKAKPARGGKRVLEEEALPSHMHSLKLYRRIALTFVVLVGVVLAVVLYVSTVEARIRVKPVGETVKADLILDVVKTPTRENEIRGRVLATSLSRTSSFKPAGAGKEVVGTSRGTVTLFNKTGSSQTLVKTTRLLTPDGKLYRIDAQVTVPAGGSVDAPAYADQTGGTFDVQEATFTIPGLPSSLQSLIYAQTKGPFTGGTRTVSVVSAEDIARAETELKEQVAADAKAALRTQAGTVFTGESFAVEVTGKKASVEPGTETDRFDLTLDVKVIGAFYDRQGAGNLAERKLYEQLKPGREFHDVNLEALQTSVEKADLKGETATVKVYLDGTSVPSTNSSALAPSRFTGKTADQIRALLVGEGIAEEVTVEFFPPFIRKAPRLPDHVIVEVE
ncbi:hypothetical protein EPO34_02275 [Patescibacteria group bacterium]|nr:MAG: hypothetical protein EPO34_02275 [Patescibacteria group bacterium]